MLSYTPWQKLPAWDLKENTHHKTVLASKHVCDLNPLLLSTGQFERVTKPQTPPVHSLQLLFIVVAVFLPTLILLFLLCGLFCTVHSLRPWKQLPLENNTEDLQLKNITAVQKGLQKNRRKRKVFRNVLQLEKWSFSLKGTH